MFLLCCFCYSLVITLDLTLASVFSEKIIKEQLENLFSLIITAFSCIYVKLSDILPFNTIYCDPTDKDNKIENSDVVAGNISPNGERSQSSSFESGDETPKGIRSQSPVRSLSPEQSQAPEQNQLPVQSQAPEQIQLPEQSQAPVRIQLPEQSQAPVLTRESLNREIEALMTKEQLKAIDPEVVAFKTQRAIPIIKEELDPFKDLFTQPRYKEPEDL
jgi:hypothetical protein